MEEGSSIPTDGSVAGEEREGESLLDLEAESNMIELLDDKEAKKFEDFDPKLKDQEVWQPPQSMMNFLEKHFNQSLATEE